jgi:hypothetical protein
LPEIRGVSGARRPMADPNSALLTAPVKSACSVDNSLRIKDN